MRLSDLLTAVDVTDPALVAVDPATRFVIVATENGPERVDSNFRRVDVPMHDWQATRVDEDDEIVKTLVEAAAANPLKLPSPTALTESFWIKQRGWKAMLCCSDLLGKFLIPDGLEVVTNEHVPPNQLVLVGPGAGFYVRQGHRRGVVSNRAAALLQVQFYVV